MERPAAYLTLTARLVSVELGGLAGSSRRTAGASPSDDPSIAVSTEPEAAAALPAPLQLQWPALSAALLTAAVLFTSALIVLANLLVVVSMARCQHRLQTAGSSLLLALSLSDGLLGLVVPVALLLPAPGGPLRLLPAAAVAALSVTSVLTTAAIAGDRCASLAWPLRYSTLVTRRGVTRYVAAVWLCGLLAGAGVTCGSAGLGDVTGSSSSSGEGGSGSSSSSSSSGVCALDLPERTLAAVAAGAVFIFAASIILSSYLYVYCVARTHVKAIRTVEASLGVRGSGSPAGGRCGALLLLVVVAFLLCWGPLAAGVVLRLQWLYCGGPVRDWLVLLGVSSAAANPFLYSLNSAELQLGCKRLLCALLARLRVRRRRAEAAQNASVALRMGSGVRLCAAGTVNQSYLVAPLYPAGLTDGRELVSVGGTVAVTAPATAV